MTRRSEPRSGIGDSDYPMSLDDILLVLSDWQANPAMGYFNESWEVFDQETSLAATGFSWSDYRPIVRTVYLDGSPVALSDLRPTPIPLPASGFLLISGLGALCLRRKMKRSGSAHN